MSQYTWQTTVYEDKLYVSTMDTTTLLEPIAQFTNGDILNMSEEEWKSQIDYIRVLIELLKGDSNTYRLSRSADNSVMNEKTAEKMVDIAIKKANLRTGNSFATMFALNYVGSDDYIELTDEQIDELVEGLLDGSIIKSSLPQESIDELMETIGDRDFSVNVISKSGTTTEPAIAFRVMKEILENKYGKEEAAKRIYATTDKAKGALKSLATEEGYETFVVPDDVGGRFSVLTAVGLLPIAASGADITKLMEGAQSMRKLCLETPIEKNDAILYAAVRNLLYRKGKSVEVLANYEPIFHYVGEWWKQLYGESEGKDQKGIFPASVDLTTDLHSMGQFIQDGSRIMYETVMELEKPALDLTVKKEENDLDGLNYLAGKTLDFVNKSAMKGTQLAHTDGNVPNLQIRIPEQNEFYLGELFYFFEYACGISGYLLGVNPFNQPGVESYKKNMFALLGKPGYEELSKELLARLS